MSKKTVVPWLVVLVVLGLAGGLVAAGAIRITLPFGSSSESRNTQIVNSVEREEKVVLVSLGIQGISTKSEKGTFFGAAIPGSDRASFILYTFDAQLGIDGKDVVVQQKGEHKFTVNVPNFIFIGHSDESFKLAAESSGILSWTTPDIDEVAMIDEILNDDAQQKYIKSNDELLRDQARSFYTHIITGIDPASSVTFTFAGDR